MRADCRQIFDSDITVINTYKVNKTTFYEAAFVFTIKSGGLIMHQMEEVFWPFVKTSGEQLAERNIN